MLQHSRIVLFLDLPDCSIIALVPFQLDQECRQTLAWIRQIDNISNASAGGQFLNLRVAILTYDICKLDRIPECLLVIVVHRRIIRITHRLNCYCNCFFIASQRVCKELFRSADKLDQTLIYARQVQRPEARRDCAERVSSVGCSQKISSDSGLGRQILDASHILCYNVLVEVSCICPRIGGIDNGNSKKKR